MLDYYRRCPTWSQLKRFREEYKDESPDEIYHFCYENFRCCIIRNYSNTSLRFGSYSVRVFGLPPYIGSWRTYYNGDLHSCISSMRSLIRQFLDGDFDVS